jgi:hypothetical protein
MMWLAAREKKGEKNENRSGWREQVEQKEKEQGRERKERRHCKASAEGWVDPLSEIQKTNAAP